MLQRRFPKSKILGNENEEEEDRILAGKSIGNIKGDNFLNILLMTCESRGYTFTQTRTEVLNELDHLETTFQIDGHEREEFWMDFKRRYREDFEEFQIRMKKAKGDKVRGRRIKGVDGNVKCYLECCDELCSVPRVTDLAKQCGGSTPEWCKRLQDYSFLGSLVREVRKKINQAKTNKKRELWQDVQEHLNAYVSKSLDRKRKRSSVNVESLPDEEARDEE
jgi:hypothetical protein